MADRKVFRKSEAEKVENFIHFCSFHNLVGKFEVGFKTHPKLYCFVAI